jgi:acyl carrier protein
VPPAEVDAVLLRHPAVADAATFGVAHSTLGEDIVAAVILRAGHAATPQQLRDFAFDALADFKVPSRIVQVSSIRRSPLGKVRRRELANMLAAALQPAYEPPRDSHEALVAELFAEVLGIERVGRFDNFFAMGGDSLRSAQIANRVNAVFDCQLDSASMFRRPTVAELAAEIAVNRRGRDAHAAPPIVRLPRRDDATPDDDERRG